MMSGSKAPDFDAYGLLRATHSHNPPNIRISKLSILNLLCQIQLLHRSCVSVFIQENTGTADLSVLRIVLLGIQ